VVKASKNKLDLEYLGAHRMKVTIYRVVPLFLVGLLLAGGCSRGVQAGAKTGEAQQVTVEMSEFKFDPATVTVKVNQPVRVSVRNTGATAHDWTVEGLDRQVKALVQPGQTESIQFTPGRTGTFRVVCTQPGHEQAGMTGQLAVQN
jgi:uncharacterized cupredoxin-like copper-binding protein